MTPDSRDRQSEVQEASEGTSGADIKRAALAAAQPRPGLSWLEIGCGTGALLRWVRDEHAPRRLVGSDILPWLDADLAGSVEFVLGPAEDLDGKLEPVDRVLLVEVLEHLEAPWTVLRRAARLVAPGGRLVAPSPNIGRRRSQLSLAARGHLGAFARGNDAHLTPIVAHVAERILAEEGLEASTAYVGLDRIPLTRRRWPERVGRERLTRRSLLIAASRPAAG